MLRFVAFTIFATLAGTAQAERCSAFVNGSEVVVEADNFATFSDDVKTREKLLAWPSRTWKKAWGAPPACDSGVLYDYLATTVPDAQIDGYCLTTTEQDGYVLIPGERNYRGQCKKTFCERVNTTKKDTVDLTRSMASAAVDTATSPENLRAIAHQSGALIMSGSAASLSANLGTAGSGVVAALSTPAALAAAGVTIVAVGGTIYMCND